MGPLSINLPAAVEPVRSAEIHVVPPWRALGSPQTIASGPAPGGYSRVTTVAVPRRLSEPNGRHEGCDSCRLARSPGDTLWPVLLLRPLRLHPTISRRPNGLSRRCCRT